MAAKNKRMTNHLTNFAIAHPEVFRARGAWCVALCRVCHEKQENSRNPELGIGSASPETGARIIADKSGSGKFVGSAALWCGVSWSHLYAMGRMFAVHPPWNSKNLIKLAAYSKIEGI